MNCLKVNSKNTEAVFCVTPNPQIGANEVLIKTHFSSLNYKDALAVTGKGAILKSYPLTPGIDVSGVIEDSQDPKWKKGDEVLITGSECGESFNGGFAEYVKAPSSVVVAKPKNLTLQETMIIGTAGFTAALALHRMEQMDQAPEKGPVVVTGASGGVGSFAIGLLKSRGYSVIALSGKKDLYTWLKHLGADEVVDHLQLGNRPLESARYGGVIDNVGGELLAQLSAHVRLWGNIACVGLASSAELKTTVMPLILRGVSFLGVSSNNCPWHVREKIWQSLSNHPPDFKSILTKTISLQEVVSHAHDMIDRKTHGRIVVRL